MCDYSLENVASRPARAGDRLISTKFANAITRGFSAIGQPDVAVCLRPGTELAFDTEVAYHSPYSHAPDLHTHGRVARFRQVDLDNRHAHHDALEFPDGEIVRLARLAEGQMARVIQMPHIARMSDIAEPVQAQQPVKRKSFARSVRALVGIK